MVRFLVVFIVLLVVLFGAQLTPWGQEYFVVPWTTGLAHFCAQAVAMFDDSAEAVGKVLKSTSVDRPFAVSIEAGCNGVEATLVLLAAILAFPATIKQRVWGLLLGILAVQGLNVVRIISLFYIGQWNMQAFQIAHEYIWQALIIIDVLIVFIVWLSKVVKSQNALALKGSDDSSPPASPQAA